MSLRNGGRGGGRVAVRKLFLRNRGREKRLMYASEEVQRRSGERNKSWASTSICKMRWKLCGAAFQPVVLGILSKAMEF